MNFSSLLGIVAALGVFATALLTSTSSREIFLNSHGILIVLGGTLAATLLCFPVSTVFTLVKVIFQKVLGRYSMNHMIVISEVIELSKGHRENPGFLKAQIASIRTPFLKEAVDLMTQGGISDQDIDQILQKRALTHFKRYEEEAGIFKIISKFPPAFGLMGTTLGMISLLQNIGSPDSFKILGPSMAIGLVATLYGIALANLILIPMGENLSKLNKEDEVLREIVMDGIKLLRKKTHPVVVEEYLKSYLLPKERLKFAKKAA